jgi:hypothetical protein
MRFLHFPKPGLRYVVAAVALVVALLINVAATYGLRANAQAVGGNRAGLIVQLKDGRTITRCVSFNEAEISGYDLLRRAKLAVIADVSSGGAICKIADTGCNFPAQQCFCECQDLNQTCIYWIYYFQANGAWKYSSLGAAMQKVTNGAVNGWVYGVGNASGSALTPPLLTFDQICADGSATTTSPATAVPATTAPISTALPTAAPSPTAAPRPTEIPVITATLKASATPDAGSTALVTATEAISAALAASATAQPQSSPTALPTLTATPGATNTPVQTASTTLAPTAALTTATDRTSNTSNNTSSYLLFGGIAAALVVVLLVTRRKSKTAGPNT